MDNLRYLKILSKVSQKLYEEALVTMSERQLKALKAEEDYWLASLSDAMKRGDLQEVEYCKKQLKELRQEIISLGGN